jgi:hypothetical protein
MSLQPAPQLSRALCGKGMVMTTFHVRATSTGRVVSYSQLKRGVLRDASRLGSLFFTTTLPDVITDILDLCQSFDKDYRIVTVIPNSATSAALDLAITGKGFNVLCSRRLVRGLFPLNPFAAEFGSNYDVIVTINAEKQEIRDKIVQSLQSKYSCKTVA